MQRKLAKSKVIGSRGGDGEQESVTPLKEAPTIRFRYLSAWKRGPWLTEPLKCQEKLDPQVPRTAAGDSLRPSICGKGTL